jgi:hypothetical protein
MERMIREEVFFVMMNQYASFLNDSLCRCCSSKADNYVLKGKILRDFSPEKMEVRKSFFATNSV